VEPRFNIKILIYINKFTGAIMPDFDKLLNRHGESWIQDIIERIERNEGRRASASSLTLEQRWASLMDSFSSPALAA
jgi:hypothetical protein